MSNQDDNQSEHDGIIEHDNRLPNWWLGTLFGAIVFSFAYWLYYETVAVGALQAAELAYDESALQAKRDKAAGELSEKALIERAENATAVAAGEAVFKSNCVACHATHGEGLVGPNLTDAFWLHGGKPLQIYTTISKGVIEKGMVAWAPTLGEARVRDVTAFVLTLKNKNLPGKAPQGEKEP